MHELAVGRLLVTETLERVGAGGGRRVTAVDVVLGARGDLDEGAVRQHFRLAARGTLAEGAMMRIAWAPARLRCFDCLFEFASHSPAPDAVCPRCGGTALSFEREVLAYVRSVEVSE